jgi:putative ABC transport system permease protein
VFKFLPYILKTLWRHRSRTLLTVSGSAVAIFVYCFVGSVQQGMDDLQNRESAKQSLVMFQANKFCPFTSHLPQDYEAKIKKLSGVREVVPIQVFTNNCRASLDVIVFYGVPPAKLRTARDFHLLSGDWADFEQHQDSAVVGRAVASRRNLKAGDKFSIGELTVQVAGIFGSNDAAEENYIYTHLDYLQRGKSRDQVGTVTQHEILLEPNVDVTSKSKEIDDLFRGGPVLTDTRAKGVFQAKSLGDLTQLIGLARYLAYACVGLILALVATTTVMSVQDRIMEHAVLQTLGVTSGRVFRLVVSESTLLSTAGGLCGVAAAMLVLQFSHLSVGAEAVTIAFQPSWTLALSGIIICAIVGVLAGIAPGWHAARTNIVRALRT